MICYKNKTYKGIQQLEDVLKQNDYEHIVFEDCFIDFSSNTEGDWGLDHVSVGHCIFRNCSFLNFTCSEAGFRHCEYYGCRFDHCDYLMTTWDYCKFDNCEFIDGDLSAGVHKSEFIKCKFGSGFGDKSESYFSYCSFIECWLYDFTTTSTDFLKTCTFKDCKGDDVFQKITLS